MFLAGERFCSNVSWPGCSSISALVAQTFLSWRTGILLGSLSRLKVRRRFWRCFLSSWRVDSRGWWLLWYNMIHDSLKKFARKLISRKTCSDPFWKRLTSFSVGLSWTVCSFVCDFIALEIMESVLTFLDDKFCKFNVLYTCTGGACALETRRWFVTERGEKRERKFKPRPHCLGNYQFSQKQHHHIPEQHEDGTLPFLCNRTSVIINSISHKYGQRRYTRAEN